MTISEKVKERIDWISQYSIDESGGLTRLLYSPEWKKTQELMRTEYESMGFVSQYDSVGNLYITLQGETDETIMIGSHIDTVKNGGSLDGQFGIVAGLITLEYLQTNFGKPKKSICVVSLAEEEGSRFPFTFWGSKNLVKSVDYKDVVNLVDENDITFESAITQAGFSPRAEDEDFLKNVSAFIEIHIEQGQILEQEKLQVGLVTDIVGQKRYRVEVLGQANHAGTTPMSYRKDALLASSKMISYVSELARELSKEMVATVGQLEVSPNSSNVIPGKVNFTIDVRHKDSQLLEEYDKQIQDLLKEVANQDKVEVSINQYMDGYPVPLDKNLLIKVEETCQKLDLSYKQMVSGAGHDAQILAPVIPTALIFVPSINGISHNPAEETKLEDLAIGNELLIELIKELSY